MGVREAFSKAEKEAKAKNGESLWNALRKAITPDERHELLVEWASQVETRLQELEERAVYTTWED